MDYFILSSRLKDLSVLKIPRSNSMLCSQSSAIHPYKMFTHIESSLSENLKSDMKDWLLVGNTWYENITLSAEA